MTFREDRPTHVSPQTSEDIVKALSARLPAEVILSHLSELPPSYIARTPADVIGDHILLFIRAEGRTAVEHTRRGDSDEITIVASDRPGILSGLAGTLATHGVSILGGAIHTRESGHALDVLSVRRLETAASSWEDLCADIASVLDGRTTVDEAAIPSGAVAVATRMPTIVYVSNEASSPFTLVEVNAPDRLGILYAIAKAMAGLELDIHLAQIETLGTTTVDTFHLRRSDGTRLETAEDILALRRAITSAVEALG
ncbi:MAG: hypothetical protein KC458_01920 [Dehalococcoidia bacterium]|nr:hypothetical protein [Dehalococcoidia bacterium]